MKWFLWFSPVALAWVLVTAGPGMSHARAEQGVPTVPAAAEEPGKPDGNEAQALEQEIQSLIEELKALGKDVQEKVKEDILPRVREEIHKLREKLQELDEQQQQKKKKEEPAETRRI